MMFTLTITFSDGKQREFKNLPFKKMLSILRQANNFAEIKTIQADDKQIKLEEKK